MLLTFLIMFVALVSLTAVIFGSLRFREKYRMQKYFEMSVTPRNAEERAAAKAYMEYRLGCYRRDIDHLAAAHSDAIRQSVQVANPTAASVGYFISTQRMHAKQLAQLHRSQTAATRIFERIYKESLSEAPAMAGATVRA